MEEMEIMCFSPTLCSLTFSLGAFPYLLTVGHGCAGLSDLPGGVVGSLSLILVLHAFLRAVAVRFYFYVISMEG